MERNGAIWRERAKSKEQRAKGKGQRAKGKEQRAKGKGQRSEVSKAIADGDGVNGLTWNRHGNRRIPGFLWSLRISPVGCELVGRGPVPNPNGIPQQSPGLRAPRATLGDRAPRIPTPTGLRTGAAELTR